MVVLDFLGLKAGIVTFEDSFVFIFWSLERAGGMPPWGEEEEVALPLSNRFLTKPALTMPLLSVLLIQVATGGDLMCKSCKILDCVSPDPEPSSADFELQTIITRGQIPIY